LKALQIALCPFAIARIQLVVVKGSDARFISLEDAEWKIAVVEGMFLAVI
jgi:hypothetical protein